MRLRPRHWRQSLPAGLAALAPAILSALNQNGLRATMFNEGQYAAAYPAQAQAEVNAGMWVGKPNGSGNTFGVTITTNGQTTWPSASCSTA